MWQVRGTSRRMAAEGELAALAQVVIFHGLLRRGDV
jgi:hypothetical protein